MHESAQPNVRHQHLRHVIRVVVLLGLCAAVWWLTGTTDRPATSADVATSGTHADARPKTAPAGEAAEQDTASTIDALHAAIRSHDARTLWSAANTLRECADFRNGVDAYAADTRQVATAIGQPTGAAYRDARARMQARCAMFSGPEARRLLTADARRLLLTRAARAGSLPAELALLAERAPLSTRTNDLDDLMARVAASRDPDVARQMADVLLDERLKPLVARHYGGVPTDHRGVSAWLIAACARGLDCRAHGAFATQACASGAFMACGSDDFITALMREQRSEADMQGVIDAIHVITTSGD